MENKCNPKPSERPELYQWEWHNISYRVPVLPGGSERNARIDQLVIQLLNDFYEGGEMSQYQAYIYHVAAVEEPTPNAMEDGAVSRLILPPTAVLANGRSAAIALAASLIKETWEPTRTRFLVKQFVGDNA